jgi:hypothetical protein
MKERFPLLNPVFPGHKIYVILDELGFHVAEVLAASAGEALHAAKEARPESRSAIVKKVEKVVASDR